MAKKVYLSPPYHWYNKCAVSGCDENTHNNEYLDELEVYLHAAGIKTKRGYRRPPKDSTTDGDQLMINAVKESDAWGADVHYVSHTNAANGKARGCRPMIYTGSANGEKLAKIMVKHRKAVTGQSVTLFRRTDLYELRKPKAVSYYEEHVFHDNAADAQWFHENMRLVAQAAARGLCEYLGVKFVDPYAKPAVTPSKPSQEATTASVPVPVLSEGDKGGYVLTAQILLNAYNDAQLDPDGDFGAKTKAAVVAYQKSRGLEADGIIGAKTWAQLLK